MVGGASFDDDDDDDVIAATDLDLFPVLLPSLVEPEVDLVRLP